MDAFLNIKTEEVQLDGKDTFHNHRYEPTSYQVLKTLFNELKLESSDVLVDYGSGLGRVCFYSEFMYHLTSRGVEMNEEYYKRSLENLENYVGDKSKVSFFLSSAEDYLPHDDETLFYFFNPFSVNIFKRVITNIMKSYQNNPRKIRLVLYYPENETIFFIEQHTKFKLVDEIAAVENIRSNYRERFAVYEIEE